MSVSARRRERSAVYRGSVAKKLLLFSTEAKDIRISGYEVSKADEPEPAELFAPHMLKVSSARVELPRWLIILRSPSA
ncbi:MAG: hypothetical protein WCF79_04930 [Rhodomicrobium sp.]